MTQINSIPQAVFGPGSLYVTRNDIANQTPYNIGYAQEFSYDEAADTKELYGQNQYPLVVARGTIKATGKMKAATLSGLAINAVFNGQSFSSGQLQLSQAQSQTVPATPYQVTPTVPNSGTFDTDLGVIAYATGLPLQRVASGPATGQYAVRAGGVYTFAAADTTLVMLVSYAYTTTGAGQTITITNSAIGTTPSFQLDYCSTLYGSSYYVRMYACISSKLSRAHKLTDFVMPEVDFNFFQNSAGKVYEISYATAS